MSTTFAENEKSLGKDDIWMADSIVLVLIKSLHEEFLLFPFTDFFQNKFQLFSENWNLAEMTQFKSLY